MSRMHYTEVKRRLMPAAEALFREMVAERLSAKGNDVVFFVTNSLGGLSVTMQSAAGDSWERNDLDGAAFEDLVEYGLLQFDGSFYRIGSEGIAFYRWLLEQDGSPIAEVERETLRLVDDQHFGAAHSGAVRHLREALGLLSSRDDSVQVLSMIGDHLRKALMDVTNDVVGPPAAGSKDAERPAARLAEWLDGPGHGLQDRERRVVKAEIALVEAVLSLDHRVNHVRDEEALGRAPVSWEEARRAVFRTVFACWEVEQMAAAGKA